MKVIQDRTRLEIRESILRALGGIYRTATGGGDNASLIDTYGLQGGDDEHNGKMVYMTKVAGATATDKTWVTDYDSSTHDATLSPTVSGVIASGDIYEMYPRPFNVDDINDVIERASVEVARKCLQIKQTATTYTERDRYKYNCLSGFEGLHTVEYCSYIGESEEISDCNSTWDAATNVTVSLDTEIYRRSSNCNKLVVADGVAAGALFATETISETDFSNYDTIEFWIYSTIAQTAGYLEFYLDDTAACASPTDTMSLPAITADTWTRVQLTLTNPELDTAIISIGLGQKAATDVGACTIWIDDVKALKSSSRVFMTLNNQHWDVVRGSTNYLKLTPSGLLACGQDILLRLNGYQLPEIMDADTDTSQVDPEFVVEYVLAYLALYHAKARQFDIDNREDFGKLHLAMAEKKKQSISTNFHPNTVFI